MVLLLKASARVVAPSSEISLFRSTRRARLVLVAMNRAAAAAVPAPPAPQPLRSRSVREWHRASACSDSAYPLSPRLFPFSERRRNVVSDERDSHSDIPSFDDRCAVDKRKSVRFFPDRHLLGRTHRSIARDKIRHRSAVTS